MMMMCVCVCVCLKLSAIRGSRGTGDDVEPMMRCLGRRQHDDGDGMSGGSSCGGTSSPDSFREATSELPDHPVKTTQDHAAAEAADGEVVVTSQDLLAGLQLIRLFGYRV